MEHVNRCLKTALALKELRHDVIPVGCLRDGVWRSKDPGLVKGWQEKDWTEDELRDAFVDCRRGVGLRLSLDTVIDIEADTKEADQFGDNLLAGTPTVVWRGAGEDGHYPGKHRLFRLTPEQQAFFAAHSINSKTKCPGGVEVRTSGMSVLPPSNGREWITHPSFFCVDEIPFLPDRVFTALFGATQTPHKSEPLSDAGVTSDSPGADFCQRADWGDVLTPHGWQVHPNGHVTRPGKSEGVSGTWDYCESETRGDLLYIFSTSPEIAPLESGVTYSKFEAYAWLNHDGDFSEAARELRRQGYGGGTDFDPDSFFDDLSEKTGDIPYKISCEPQPEKELAPYLADEWFEGNPIGEYCLALRDYTAVDTTAVYLQALEVFGAMVGRNAWYRYGPSRRFLSDYLILAGETGSGKGVTFDYAKLLFTGQGEEMFSPVAEAFDKLTMGRMGSGEGLIEALLAKGEEINPQYERCLLLVEQEGVGSFSKMAAENSTLADNLLKAWDANSLSNCTKGRSLYVKNPLVSIIWHVTPNVVENLPVSFLHGGLVNRLKFLTCQKPEKPDNPKAIPGTVLGTARQAIEESLSWVAKEERELSFSPAAGEVFAKVAEFQHGLTGGTALANERYAAHVERTACRLAMLVGESVVDKRAADAAVAIQETCFRSAENLILAMKMESETSGFAGRNRDRVNLVVQFLFDHPGKAFTRTELRNKALGGRTSASEIDAALLGATSVEGVKSGKRTGPNNARKLTMYWAE